MKHTALALVAFVAFTGTASAEPTIRQLERKAAAVTKKEARDEHAFLKFGDRPKVRAKCDALTRKRFKCEWSGGHDDGQGGRVAYFGKATTRKFAHGWTVRLYDEKCYDDTGIYC